RGRPVRHRPELPICDACDAPRDSRGLFPSRGGRSRRADELRDRYSGHVASGRRLCRPSPQRRQACRPAGHAGHQIRIRHQSGDRASARVRSPADATRARRRGDRMRRRDFITLIGGAAVAWPLAASAQQRERMRSVGVLTPFAAHNTEGQNRVTAFAQALQQLGWSVGQNARLHYRWGDGTSATMQKYAAELVALAPDVILADSSAALSPLLQATQTIPIVFAIVADPVGAGYVETLA